MDQEGMREVFSVATHQEAECRLDLDGGADAAAWIHSTAPPPKPGPLLVRRTTPTAACAGATAASSAAAVTAMAGGARGEEQRAGRRAGGVVGQYGLLRVFKLQVKFSWILFSFKVAKL